MSKIQTNNYDMNREGSLNEFYYGISLSNSRKSAKKLNIKVYTR